MLPQPDDGNEGCTYYMTLLRDDLHVRSGDCYYLMPEKAAPAKSKDQAPVRMSYKSYSANRPYKLDLFRVERLWIADE